MVKKQSTFGEILDAVSKERAKFCGKANDDKPAMKQIDTLNPTEQEYVKVRLLTQAGFRDKILDFVMDPAGHDYRLHLAMQLTEEKGGDVDSNYHRTDEIVKAVDRVIDAMVPSKKKD